MEYRISYIERKITGTGKSKADCTLIDINGVATNGVSIWADFPGFAELTEDSVVQGELFPARDPKYGPTLYPPKGNRQSAGAGGGKTQAIAGAMERKEQGIKRAQDTKELGIKVAGAGRDATLLLTTFYAKETDGMTPFERDAYLKKKHKELSLMLIHNFDELKDYLDIPF